MKRYDLIQTMLVQTILALSIVIYPHMASPAAESSPLPRDTTYTIAVLNFTTSEDMDKKMGAEIATLLTVQLSTHDRLVTVEREELDTLLGEQELGLSGTVDPATATMVGHLTGAQVIITGRVFPLDNDLYLVAKIMGTETGRVYGEAVTTPVRASRAEAVRELTGRVAQTLLSKGHTLIAKRASQADHLARLQQLVKGKKLPTVSVRIREESLQRRSIDPAAETEVALVLNKLGFAVMDPAKAVRPPDIEIVGEAFSAFGLRRGNLVTSTGRVECKAIERVSGRVLAVGRHTEVAVDLAEEAAGKAAIQHAAFALAVRLVPQLLQAQTSTP